MLFLFTGLIMQNKMMFGLQQYSRRYSTPSNLRGTKLSLSDMNRTQSLKFRKINQIQTARTHLPDYQYRPIYQLASTDNQLETNSLFYSHSKILKSFPPRLKNTKQSNLKIQPSRMSDERQEQEQSKMGKSKIIFYSSNLDQNMNVYLNKLLNKSEKQRKQKIKKIQQTINMTHLHQINSNRTTNQFWRKMRKSIARKERNQLSIVNNRPIFLQRKIK